MKPSSSSSRGIMALPGWLFALLLVAQFGFLLGTRNLNEPDEGRYAEIAREMVETGDWLVPHINYVPHLDKPPMTYWLVATSIRFLGNNAWAVRLPLALAGLLGIWGTMRLTRSLAGEAAARWSAVFLSTSLLYFGLARMLTTDIFLCVTVIWTVDALWRAWRALDDLDSEDEDERAAAGKRAVRWLLAGWLWMAAGFLVKGPLSLLFPLAAFAALIWNRRKETAKISVLVLGNMAGLALFAALALPWFLMVFEQVPKAFDFMVRGQVVEHAIDAQEKGRHAPLLYFVPILLAGFLPWTPLLGWVWRKAHWKSLDAEKREGWLMLSVWAAFTFAIFTFNSAKRPAYILPMFPPLATLAAWRLTTARGEEIPRWLGAALLVGPGLLGIGFMVAWRWGFHSAWDACAWGGGLVAMASAVILPGWVWKKNWPPLRCVTLTAVLAAAQLVFVVVRIPVIETVLRSNQTLAPLGAALRAEYRPGDRVVCWDRFPQGLLFHAQPVLNAANRSYLGNMPLNRIPFEFPGNTDRFGDQYLPDDAALGRLLMETNRVLVIGFDRTDEHLQKRWPDVPWRVVTKVGEWELLSDR